VDKLGGVRGCMFGVMSDWVTGCTILFSFDPLFFFFFLLGLGWTFVWLGERVGGYIVRRVYMAAFFLFFFSRKE